MMMFAKAVLISAKRAMKTIHSGLKIGVIRSITKAIGAEEVANSSKGTTEIIRSRTSPAGNSFSAWLLRNLRIEKV